MEQNVEECDYVKFGCEVVRVYPHGYKLAKGSTDRTLYDCLSDKCGVARFSREVETRPLCVSPFISPTIAHDGRRSPLLYIRNCVYSGTQFKLSVSVCFFFTLKGSGGNRLRRADFACAGMVTRAWMDVRHI